MVILIRNASNFIPLVIFSFLLVEILQFPCLINTFILKTSWLVSMQISIYKGNYSIHFDLRSSSQNRLKQQKNLPEVSVINEYEENFQEFSSMEY